MRAVSWIAGIAVLLVATCGWAGVYGQTLIVAFTTQFLLLLLVVPLLLAWGRPISLAARTLPPPWGGRASRIVTGPVGSVVTHPAVAPLLVPVVTFGVFFTPVLQNVLLHKGTLQALRLALVLAGFLFALPLSGEDGALSSLGVMLGLFVGLVELIVDAVPGFTWRYKHNVFAPAWVAKVGRPWPPTPIHDQHLAANVLWIVAELLDLPFVALTFRRWVKVDEQEARRVDAALDARRAPAPIGPTAAAQVDDDGMETPWWETRSRGIDPARTAAYRAEGVRRRAAEAEEPGSDGTSR
jgi:putative copper resistance protein D